jgi:pimeloyl-ACP methyl ester carboxylesterase
VSLQAELGAFPLVDVATASGAISYRRAAPAQPVAGALPLVLLHGIGSASASWIRQLQRFGGEREVLAWNAPGYPGSAALPMAEPAAADYARAVWAWLDALGLDRVTLVGHSLGCLMAGAAIRIAPQRVARVVLLAPASGYGAADPEVRATKLRDRLHALETLGPAGMADKRGAAMLSPGASAEQIAFIKSVMAQVEPHGYAQAARMLSGGNLAADAAGITCPVTVASGNADTITPSAGCQRIAAAAGTPWIDLGAVGHACPLEASERVNALIAAT